MLIIEFLCIQILSDHGQRVPWVSVPSVKSQLFVAKNYLLESLPGERAVDVARLLAPYEAPGVACSFILRHYGCHYSYLF